MEASRPNPDDLLKQAQEEEQRRTRGRLKIFLGAAAGVGKTYAMLEAAQARKAEGLDVLVGIVETHGRRETEALLTGLDIVPPRFIEYRSTKLREFDLEAALARAPALLLVDELAHTNAPGCRNAKRWQDVQSLLDAGISVYTTLNVQHLESLNDVIAQITGIAVRETLPDSVLDDADEIELVDLPPDDLLRRLKEGKVYMPEQAGLAVENFFRKGNLIALRELALRTAAERVDQQARAYRRAQAITRTWRTSERILVCVSPSPLSENLIRAARRMAMGLRAEWTAVTVEPRRMTDADRKRLVEHLGLAQQLGAETATLVAEDKVEAIVEFARHNNVTKIIAGKPGSLGWRERFTGSFVGNLIRASGDIDVYIIKGEAESARVTRAASIDVPIQWKRYGAAVLTVALCTGIAALLHGSFGLANLVMLYLLGVAVVAAKLGHGPAVLCSILSVAAFDFFFVSPPLTLAVADSQYLLTFAVMLAVALMISILADRLRRQAVVAQERERRTALLHAISGRLSAARKTPEIADILVRDVPNVLRGDVAVILPGPDGRLVVRAGNESAFPLNARERGVAHWVFDLGRSAGVGTDTIPSAECLYLPLTGTRGTAGVLALHPAHGAQGITPELLQLLEAVAAQAGLAIENDAFAEEARRSQVAAETEKSRNALLNSVSHDLRTPLSAITGAASTLLEEGDALTPATRRELVESIGDEAAHMSRLITNLLEMTRLESGAVAVTKELCPIEEVIGAARNRLDKQLARHRVTVDLPADLPPVSMDVLLMEHVFINLLENAAKFAPAGSEVAISAGIERGCLSVTVADRGPGLAPGDEQRIFEKFYRGKSEKAAAGVGLGLTICRAIIEAHGGTIRAENRPDGGAAFRFALPLDVPPPPSPGGQNA